MTSAGLTDVTDTHGRPDLHSHSLNPVQNFFSLRFFDHFVNSTGRVIDVVRI